MLSIERTSWKRPLCWLVVIALWPPVASAEYITLDLEGLYTERHDRLDDGYRGFWEYYTSPDISYFDIPFRVKTEGINTVSSTVPGREAFQFPIGRLGVNRVYMLGVGTYLAHYFGHNYLWCDDPTHFWFEIHYGDGTQEQVSPTDYVTGFQRWADILYGAAFGLGGEVESFPASPIGLESRTTSRGNRCARGTHPGL